MKSIHDHLSVGCGLLFAALLVQSGYAEDGHGWFVRAGVSLGEPEFHDTLHVNNGSGFPPPLNHDAYSTRKDNAATASLVAGYRWIREQSRFPIIGLGFNYLHLFSNDIHGDITQYSLPQFKNYRYTWAVESDVLAVVARINLMPYQRLLPYVEGGLGMAWNTASDYRETALAGVTPRITPGFRDKAWTHATYSLGAGVDFILTPKITLSLGYEFRDWGPMASRPGELTWSGERLYAGHYRTQSGLLGVTYLFGQPGPSLSK